MDMIHGEIISLIRAFTAGVFLRGIYAVIRMKRSLFPTGRILRGMEDILYWIFSFAFLFVLWQEAFLGIPRIYGFLAVILGMYLCYKGPEGLIFKVFVKCVAQPLKKCFKLIKLKAKRKKKREKEDTEDEPQKTSSQNEAKSD